MVPDPLQQLRHRLCHVPEQGAGKGLALTEQQQNSSWISSEE